MKKATGLQSQSNIDVNNLKAESRQFKLTVSVSFSNPVCLSGAKTIEGREMFYSSNTSRLHWISEDRIRK